MSNAPKSPSLTEEQVRSQKLEMQHGKSGGLYHSSLEEEEIEILDRLLNNDTWVRLNLGEEQKIGKIIRAKREHQGYPQGAVLFSYGESRQLVNSLITTEVEYWDNIARKWRQIIYRD